MTQSGERKRALIVEDDGGQSELGALMLEEFDLSVRQLSTAEDALDHLRQDGGSVAMVVADIGLPGPMDGLALARSVSVLWPSVSVIVTSGGPSPDSADLPDGCVFVPKPWRALDIVAAAERAARINHSVHAVQL